jgi:transcriptional regulator with XRE-family HTH domain
MLEVGRHILMESYFGKAFKLARLRTNKSQAGVARIAGMDPTYLASIENGRRTPPKGKKLASLLSSLGVSEAESKRLELLACLDLIIHEGEKNIREPNDPVSRVVALLNKIPEMGEAELRFLLITSEALAKQATSRREDW